MEWYELLIVIPLFLVAIAIIDYFAGYGGMSDYEVDKHNKEIHRDNYKVWLRQKGFPEDHIDIIDEYNYEKTKMKWKKKSASKKDDDEWEKIV